MPIKSRPIRYENLIVTAPFLGRDTFYYVSPVTGNYRPVGSGGYESPGIPVHLPDEEQDQWRPEPGDPPLEEILVTGTATTYDDLWDPYRQARQVWQPGARGIRVMNAIKFILEAVQAGLADPEDVPVEITPEGVEIKENVYDEFNWPSSAPNDPAPDKKPQIPVPRYLPDWEIHPNPKPGKKVGDQKWTGHPTDWEFEDPESGGSYIPRTRPTTPYQPGRAPQQVPQSPQTPRKPSQRPLVQPRRAPRVDPWTSPWRLPSPSRGRPLPNIPEFTITLEPNKNEPGLDYTRKVRPNPRLRPAERRKRRQDKKSKSQMAYMAMLRLITRTFGTMTELADLWEAFMDNTLVRDQDRWIPMSMMDRHEQYAVTHRLYGGTLDMADVQLDVQGLARDLLMNEIGDAIVAKQQNIQSKIFQEFGGLFQSNMLGNPATWASRAGVPGF